VYHRSGERAARLALHPVPVPCTYVRERREHSVNVLHAPKERDQPALLAALNLYRARPPSVATATTAMVARNGKSPRRATIVPPSRTHSNAIVTLLAVSALGSAQLDRLLLGDRPAILRQARAHARGGAIVAGNF